MYTVMLAGPQFGAEALPSFLYDEEERQVTGMLSRGLRSTNASNPIIKGESRPRSDGNFTQNCKWDGREVATRPH